MAAPFRYTRNVDFVETDMAGIVHFSNFFRYMEACETAFYHSLGVPIALFSAGKFAGWPRVQASCEYLAPLRYPDRCEVRMTVREVRTRAVRYGFEFRRIVRGRPAAKPVARGEITAVCVQADARGQMKAVRIPARVRARLAALAV